MQIRLPVPANWQDFESICHRLWKDIWNDPNAQRNGRAGQSQNGVDIFGNPIYSTRYSGVQCKDKDGRLGSALRAKELKAECGKATKFSPGIGQFAIATTAPRDESIQAVARELTDRREYPFEVQIWSWDDIESELLCRPSIVKYYYQDETIGGENLTSIKMNRYTSRESLHAYFSRPLLGIGNINQLSELLVPVIYELSDNAYKYGNATYFRITYSKGIFTLSDNGREFDPLSGLNPELVCKSNNVGAFVFHHFKKKMGEALKISYQRKIIDKEKVNCVEMRLLKDIPPNLRERFVEANIDISQAYGKRRRKKSRKKLMHQKRHRRACDKCV